MAKGAGRKHVTYCFICHLNFEHMRYMICLWWRVIFLSIGRLFVTNWYGIYILSLNGTCIHRKHILVCYNSCQWFPRKSSRITNTSCTMSLLRHIFAQRRCCRWLIKLGDFIGSQAGQIDDQWSVSRTKKLTHAIHSYPFVCNSHHGQNKSQEEQSIWHSIWG